MNKLIPLFTLFLALVSCFPSSKDLTETIAKEKVAEALTDVSFSEHIHILGVDEWITGLQDVDENHKQIKALVVITGLGYQHNQDEFGATTFDFKLIDNNWIMTIPHFYDNNNPKSNLNRSRSDYAEWTKKYYHKFEL